MERKLLQFNEGVGAWIWDLQHERIRQSAYRYISEKERKELHAKLGWLLAERMKAGENIQIDQVVYYLNQGADQVVLQRREQELADLNLQAGIAARQSIAFEDALYYLRKSTDLISEDNWVSSYSLIFQAFKDRSRRG